MSHISFGELPESIKKCYENCFESAIRIKKEGKPHRIIIRVNYKNSSDIWEKKSGRWQFVQHKG